VSYNSANVPVYEGEGKNNDPVQIIIGDFSSTPAGNQRTFGSQARQVIQVVSQQATIKRKPVDVIGEQVMSLISPTPTGDALDGDDFNVNIIGMPSINHITEDSASGSKIVRLILSYDLLITNK
jgi:hypothetical protein